MHASLARLIHMLVTDGLFRAELQADFECALTQRHFATSEENKLALKAALKELESHRKQVDGGEIGPELIGWDVGGYHYTSVALNGA